MMTNSHLDAPAAQALVHDMSDAGAGCGDAEEVPLAPLDDPPREGWYCVAMATLAIAVFALWVAVMAAMAA